MEPDDCRDCPFRELPEDLMHERCMSCPSWRHRKLWYNRVGTVVDFVVDENRLTCTIDEIDFVTALQRKNKGTVTMYLEKYSLKHPMDLFSHLGRMSYSNIHLGFILSVTSDDRVVERVVGFLASSGHDDFLKFLLLNLNLTLERVIDLGYRTNQSITAVNHNLMSNTPYIYEDDPLHLVRIRIYDHQDALSPESLNQLNAMLDSDSDSREMSLFDFLSVGEYELFELNLKRHDAKREKWEEEGRKVREKNEYELSTIPGLLETIREGKHQFTEKHRYANWRVRNTIDFLKERAKTEEIPGEILSWFEQDERKYVREAVQVIKRRNENLVK